jgi:hypothetical protein
MKNKIHAEILKLEKYTLLKIFLRVFLPLEEACDINWKCSFLSSSPKKQNKLLVISSYTN